MINLSLILDLTAVRAKRFSEKTFTESVEKRTIKENIVRELSSNRRQRDVQAKFVEEFITEKTHRRGFFNI